jgi:hypothetical protein
MDQVPLTEDLCVCAVCRRPLDLHTWEEEGAPRLEWLHAERDAHQGHDPVPVSAVDTGNEIVGRCDFCSQAGPSWTYPCSDFVVSVGPFNRGFVGDWAACSLCHKDIQLNRWTSVSSRSAKAASPGTRNNVKKSCEILHRMFKLNRKGDPYRTL